MTNWCWFKLTKPLEEEQEIVEFAGKQVAPIPPLFSATQTSESVPKKMINNIHIDQQQQPTQQQTVVQNQVSNNTNQSNNSPLANPNSNVVQMKKKKMSDEEVLSK